MKKSELRQIIREEIQKLHELEAHVKKGDRFNIERYRRDIIWEVIKVDETQSRCKAVTKPEKGKIQIFDNKIIKENFIRNSSTILEGGEWDHIFEARFKSVATKVHDFMDKNKLEHGETTITNNKIQIDDMHKEKHADKLLDFLKTLMPFQSTEFVKKQQNGKWYIWSK